MVQPGRVVCIFTPFVLSLAALACMVVMFISGTIEKNSTIGDLYFLKLNTTGLNLEDKANHLKGDNSNSNVTLSPETDAALRTHAQIKDYYTIYLNNYCYWDGNNNYEKCSPRETKFYFDPIKVWGLNNVTGVNATDLVPKNFQNGLDTYRKLSIAMYYMYAAGTAAAALTVLVGISAIFSRWGSFFTTFFASAAAFFIIVASAIATSMFTVLLGVLKKTLDDDWGTKTTMGSKVFALTWIGAAFAVASSLFWFISICCCSGRSPYNPGSKAARKTRAEKTPYTYERVGSPMPASGHNQYQGPNNTQSIPLANLNYKLPAFGSNQPKPQRDHGTAYEPFRSHA